MISGEKHLMAMLYTSTSDGLTPITKANIYARWWDGVME